MQHRKLFLAAASAALAIALTACSGTGAPAGTPAGTASAPQESAVVETQTPAPEAESHTLQATLNSVDTGLDFLVAVDENGNYCRFNLGGVDADGLEPGDSIQITYTGTLSDGETLDRVLPSPLWKRHPEQILMKQDGAGADAPAPVLGCR